MSSWSEQSGINLWVSMTLHVVTSAPQPDDPGTTPGHDKLVYKATARKHMNQATFEMASDPTKQCCVALEGQSTKSLLYTDDPFHLYSCISSDDSR